MGYLICLQFCGWHWNVVCKLVESLGVILSFSSVFGFRSPSLSVYLPLNPVKSHLPLEVLSVLVLSCQ